MRTARLHTIVAAAAGLSVIALTAGIPASADPAAQSSDFTTQVDSFGRTTAITAVNPTAARTADLSAAGRAQVGEIAKRFNANVGQLDVQSVHQSAGGGVVRLQQKIDGISVLGGQVVEVFDKSGALVSAHGSAVQETAGAFPADKAGAQSKADGNAIGVAAQGLKAPANTLKVKSSDATWFDPTVYGVKGEAKAVPAYKTIVANANGDQWGVLTDARNGATLLSWSESHEADTNRVICDANRKIVDPNDPANYQCGKAFDSVRAEGEAESEVEDVNRVYDYFGDTSKFYAEHTGGTNLTDMIGIDYKDGKGKALRGTVRLCVNEGGGEECPWANAFWDGEQMAFGEGVSTDDVTAHELTHGVTQMNSNLQYIAESGAINESLSDIFGEFVDMSNGSDDDTDDVRWQMGEGSSLGVIRSASDPTQFDDPDKKTSENWYDGGDNSSFVHINSGVGNKTAFLIADGGSFNGQEITGIGMDKSYALWWEIQHQLTESSDYAELATALPAACKINADGGVAGTTADDCANVEKAVAATELAGTSGQH